MAAISKFLFDTDFDAGGDPLSARPALRTDTRRFTSTEVEAAKSAAHAEGVAAGRALAEQEIGRRIADVLAVVGARLDEVMGEARANHGTRAREAVTTAAEIVRRLLPALGKREAMTEVEALITDCLARVHDEPRLVVRVSDELLDEVRQRIDQLTGAAGFAGRVILLADNTLKTGDARVEWADGGADRDTAALWREIEGAIQRFVEDGSGAPDAGRKSESVMADENLELNEMAPGQPEQDAEGAKPRSAKELEAVYDIPVQVSAVLGKATMQVSQLLKLGRGAVVELDRKVGEAIDIYVNNRLVARGEVVVVDDRLGVTMTEIVKVDRS